MAEPVRVVLSLACPLLNGELLACLAEAQVVIEDWREDYNHRRAHSALGRRTPAAFAADWTAAQAA